MIVPVRWAQGADDHRALRSANDGHLGAERTATVVVLVGVALLVLLGLVRMIVT